MTEEGKIEVVSERVEGAPGLLKWKNPLQLVVMAFFCDGDLHNIEKITEWGKEHSKQFRNIFNKRVEKEGNAFLRRCENEIDNVADEIIKEMLSLNGREKAA